MQRSPDSQREGKLRPEWAQVARTLAAECSADGWWLAERITALRRPAPHGCKAKKRKKRGDMRLILIVAHDERRCPPLLWLCCALPTRRGTTCSGHAATEILQACELMISTTYAHEGEMILAGAPDGVACPQSMMESQGDGRAEARVTRCFRSNVALALRHTRRPSALRSSKDERGAPVFD
jgi:hypothetical protein